LGCRGLAFPYCLRIAYHRFPMPVKPIPLSSKIYYGAFGYHARMFLIDKWKPAPVVASGFPNYLLDLFVIVVLVVLFFGVLGVLGILGGIVVKDIVNRLLRSPRSGNQHFSIILQPSEPILEIGNGVVKR